jgi:hypothetical protein
MMKTNICNEACRVYRIPGSEYGVRTTIEAEGHRKGKGRARHNLASFIPLFRFIITSDERYIVFEHTLLDYN